MKKGRFSLVFIVIWLLY